MSEKRVCLAYSGGLDTSTILKWLILEGHTVVVRLPPHATSSTYFNPCSASLQTLARRTSVEKKALAPDNFEHLSYESETLERIEQAPPKELRKCMANPLDAPDKPTNFSISFEKATPAKLEVDVETITGSLTIFKKLNNISRDNGVGRIDIVESTFTSSSLVTICTDCTGLSIKNTTQTNTSY
ncbi:hypothetical protein GGR58DRAFT_509093 [Xylaria digitata]|nr:hypothetical protein GGR58DRAFT_509093 [Xylaria digitata]